MSNAPETEHFPNTIAELEKRLALQEEKLQEQAQIITQLRQTEETLRKSDDAYRALFKNMLNGFAYCRMLYLDGKPDDFIYLSANDAVESLLGSKGVVGKKVTELVPGVKDTDPELLEIFGRVVMTGQSERFEKYVEALHQWFSVSVYSTEKDHFALVFDVITNRKRTQDELLRNETRLHLALESAKAGTWEWNLRTNENIWSEGLWKLYGLEPYSCKPSYDIWLETIHPDDRACIALKVREAARTGCELHAEWRVFNPDGKVRWLMSRGQPLFDTAGQVTSFIGVVIDVSECKQTQLTLRENESKWRLFIDHAPASLAMLDCDMRYLSVSRRWLSDFKLGDQDIVGHSHYDIFPEIPERWKEAHRRGVSGEVIKCDEDRFERLDGTIHWGRWEVRPWYTAENEIGGIVIFTEDITERKRVEEELAKQKNAEQFRMLLENAPDAVIVQTVERISYMNPSACRLFGITTPNQLLGQPIIDRVPPSLRATVKERMQIANKEKRKPDSPSEQAILRMDGVEVPVEVSAEPVVYEGKNGALVFFRDISKRKKAEEALRKSEEQFRSLVEGAPYGIVVRTGECISYLNLPACRLFGVKSPDELLGKPVLDYVHPAMFDIIKERMSRVDEQRERAPMIEILSTPADGREAWVEASSVPVIYEDKNSSLIFLHDITERKRAEQALRDSEQNYREVFNATGEAIVLHDANNGRMLDINDTAVRMLGFETKTEALTNRIIDISVNNLPNIQEDILHRIRLTVEEGPQTFEWQMLKKDGSCFWAEVCLRSTRIGGEGRILAVSRDITERKHAEEEKQKLQADLAHSNKLESIGRLAGGVAHEYNNMLNVIISYAELGMYSTDPSESIYKNFQEIVAAAQRSAEVTRKLLGFARKQMISPKVINLNKTIEGTIKAIRLLIGETIKLEWQPCTDAWSVRMDPVQVDQILINLCLNSRDAIQQDGTITVKTENIIIDQSYCSTFNEDFVPGDYVLLTICDNGCGMDKKTLENIFEPFFTTKEFGRSTGLGMATVYGIVKQNKGVIAVFSEHGKGTIVKTYLPRSEDLKAGLQTAEQLLESPGGTVLVVEDEKMILDVLAKTLEKLGYKILKAGSPSEALSVVKNCGVNIDLLIADVVMPEMNGRELANRLHSEYPEMKILYMSGYTADIVTSHGILEEKVNFIQKPFTMKEIANKVRKVLDKN